MASAVIDQSARKRTADQAIVRLEEHLTWPNTHQAVTEQPIHHNHQTPNVCHSELSRDRKPGPPQPGMFLGNDKRW